MRRVILESPYAGDVERNVRYARAALRDSLLRGEAPLASHLLYTQDGVLDDTIPEMRALGIAAGLSWVPLSDATVVYADHGITSGMQQGIDRAALEGRPVEIRLILSNELCSICKVRPRLPLGQCSSGLCDECLNEELLDR